MDNQYNYISPEEYETAEKNGIKRRTLEARVRDYGWSIEQAVTEPPKKYKPFQPVWEKWRSIAHENGVGRRVFYSRVREQGMTEKKAATMPVRRGGRPQTRWTNEELELIERNGLSVGTVKGRIDALGWDKDAAINTPLLTTEQRAERIRAGTRRYYRERGVNREFNKTV